MDKKYPAGIDSANLQALYDFCVEKMQICVDKVNNPLNKDLQTHYTSKFLGILTVFNELNELYAGTDKDEVFMFGYNWFYVHTRRE